MFIEVSEINNFFIKWNQIKIQELHNQIICLWQILLDEY